MHFLHHLAIQSMTTTATSCAFRFLLACMAWCAGVLDWRVLTVVILEGPFEFFFRFYLHCDPMLTTACCAEPYEMVSFHCPSLCSIRCFLTRFPSSDADTRSG